MITGPTGAAGIAVSDAATGPTGASATGARNVTATVTAQAPVVTATVTTPAANPSATEVLAPDFRADASGSRGAWGAKKDGRRCTETARANRQRNERKHGDANPNTAAICELSGRGELSAHPGPSGAVILQYPGGREAPPTGQYLDPSVDLETLPMSLVRFPGTMMVLPDREAVFNGWSAFVAEIAPDPAPVIERKDRVPYYIAGTLKEAELINERLREQRLRNGQSTIGKQRSSGHIETLGPALLLDDDGDVLAREAGLQALGAAALIYTSHSFGFPKSEWAAPAGGGRVVLCLNRSVTPAEYGPIWDAVNHLSGGGLDEHGRSPALCYGRHARRSDKAPYQRVIIDGAALDADALLELGRSLRPQRRGAAPGQKTGGRRKRALAEEIERARLMGAVRSPDAYGEWMSGAAAFKRAFPDDIEAAFQCYDAWSACSSKYEGTKYEGTEAESTEAEGTEATRRKFDQVPADYDGPAIPVQLEMLHWRARRRAEMVIHTLYSPAAKWQKASAFEGMATDSLADGIPPARGAEPIPPNSLKPEDGIVALQYLNYCWGEKVFEELLSRLAIPEPALEEARRRSEQRREKIDLAGRTLHKWEGKDLAADTAALADAIIDSNTKLYRVDQTLVRLSAPVSDPATADRVRKRQGYKGRPGEPGDPALHAGERLAPILPSDAEALREIVAAHVAAKRPVNDGTKANPIWREEIASFAFKPSARLHVEPDAAVLKDLLKRELPKRVPEIMGLITAPVMPDLPSSTNPDDLAKPGTDRLVTNPGFDAESGLYLSPLGTLVDVPESPSEVAVKGAADLLREPWADFSFVSPGDGIEPQVSRSSAIFGTILAANRRALEIAPGIAFSSHGEGMSSGKTLAGEVICTIATGKLPAPVSLSPDFTEQRKEIITHLIEGDGCLFLDNIPNGTRFDSAPLAAAMTNPRFKGRLLGANKQIDVSTRAMMVATGNALNLAGDLASRYLLARLDTGLERPEDRSAAGFTIPDLRRWVVEHRQQLVAAVHTITRAYLQECRRCGGTPAAVATRRQVGGTRFGGPCEVLRDAFLWAFPDLPDPFLSFQASAANSSTKAEAALVLGVLDRVMAKAAGQRCAPAWATTPFVAAQSRERSRWDQKFQARWNRMAADERQRRFQTADLAEAESRAWERIRGLVQIRIGRPEVRAGRVRLTSSEITKALQLWPEEQAMVEGAMHGKGLNPVSLGRWLKERLVDAPIFGRVLRSAQGPGNCAQFWITTGGVTWT